MAKRHFLQRRLQAKTQLFYLISRLNRFYNLSLAESEALSREILETMSQGDGAAFQDGQVWYTAVHKDEPAGKPLSQCRKVRVRLTLHHPDDLEVEDVHALKALVVHRLAWEAIEQDGLLTVEDLARLLFTGEKTIRRILAKYRHQEVFIPLRGYYKDIGPATSHKAQAVRLYLKGHLPSRIATMLGHRLGPVERYLDDFCVVMMGLEEGYSAPRIARNTKLSERLVREYQALYAQYKDHHDYQATLNRLRERLAYLLKKTPDGEAFARRER